MLLVEAIARGAGHQRTTKQYEGHAHSGPIGGLRICRHSWQPPAHSAHSTSNGGVVGSSSLSACSSHCHRPSCQLKPSRTVAPCTSRSRQFYSRQPRCMWLGDSGWETRTPTNLSMHQATSTTNPETAGTGRRPGRRQACTFEQSCSSLPPCPAAHLPWRCAASPPPLHCTAAQSVRSAA